MSESFKKTTQVFRNISFTQILSYRLPLPGKVSILHRISGASLFLLLPLALYLFEQSLSSEISFYMLKAFAAHIVIKFIILLLSWAFLFHFFAGVRHLLMDIHIGDTQRLGTYTAAVVFVLSTLLTIMIAFKLFGVF